MVVHTYVICCTALAGSSYVWYVNNECKFTEMQVVFIIGMMLQQSSNVGGCTWTSGVLAYDC